MEKSNIEKLKEALLYAPVGALGFLKDNAPTFFSMFVSRGKREVNKTAAQAEDVINSTKEHGQFVAMGTPVMRTKAEKMTQEAKSKGEDIASISIDAAIGVLNFLENTVKSLTESISDAPAPESVRSSSGEPSQAVAEKVADAEETVLATAEGDFVAEPANDLLPSNLREIYATLSAPEIIDRLDAYQTADLSNIKKYESEYRNRQTIIYAIDYRLNDQ